MTIYHAFPLLFGAGLSLAFSSAAAPDCDTCESNFSITIGNPCGATVTDAGGSLSVLCEGVWPACTPLATCVANYKFTVPAPPGGSAWLGPDCIPAPGMGGGGAWGTWSFILNATGCGARNDAAITVYTTACGVNPPVRHCATSFTVYCTTCDGQIGDG